MFKSILDFLTSSVPVSRWVIILMLLALVVDIAVIISSLSKRKGLES